MNEALSLTVKRFQVTRHGPQVQSDTGKETEELYDGRLLGMEKVSAYVYVCRWSPRPEKIDVRRPKENYMLFFNRLLKLFINLIRETDFFNRKFRV